MRKFFILIMITALNATRLAAQDDSRDQKIKYHDPILVAEFTPADGSPTPTSNWPAIFYTPHQDDEVLAMGGAIAEHVRVGRPVYVVLLTDGNSGNQIRLLNGTDGSTDANGNIIYNVSCGFCETTHMLNLSESAHTQARNREFLASCKALGVHKVYIANNGNGYHESHFYLNELTDVFKQTIQFFENQFPNSSHKSISGKCDKDHGEVPMAHIACVDAALQLPNIRDFRFYRDYVYGYYDANERGGTKVLLNESDLTRKRNALMEYLHYDESAQRYSIGWAHSVAIYFNRAFNSKYEYLDTLDQCNCE